MRYRKSDVKKLKELRRLLTMDRSAFCVGFSPTIVRGDTHERLDATDFIIEQTRLWRQTWILPVLDDLIKRATDQTIARHISLSAAKVRRQRTSK